ncbi:UNVERIFIED_CONTAM: uncharacterized protein (DUF2267 family) [Streptomyces graminofaciens]
MQWQQLIEQVRYSGRYATGEEAEDVLRAVLTVLGSHVSGDERCELARLLPVQAATILTAQIPLTEPLTAPGFVDAVAGHLPPCTGPEARWATSTVLCLIAQLAGEDLSLRMLSELPRGYALLFGRAELTAAA